MDNKKMFAERSLPGDSTRDGEIPISQAMAGTQSMNRILLLSLSLCLVGCNIILVLGPSEVDIGDIVTYVVDIGSNFALGFDHTVFVVAQVPVGWELQSSSYEGTVAGVTVTGNGIVWHESPCAEELGSLPAGYQRWAIRSETPFSGIVESDSAVAHLEFRVDAQPTDEFELIFVAGGGFGECSQPTVITINRHTSDLLTLTQSLLDDADGVDGLAGPSQATIVPSGRHLYVAGRVDQSVAVFERNDLSGEVAFIELEGEAGNDLQGLDLASGVAASPDGLFLYVTSRSDSSLGAQGSMTAFARDPATGALTFIDRWLADVDHLVMSPDGQNLYASLAQTSVVDLLGTSAEIHTFDRDPATGRLTFISSIAPGGPLTFSLDGKHLYSVSRFSGLDGVIQIRSRDTISGQLTTVDYLDSGYPLTNLAVSPDGNHLYAVAIGQNRLVVFARDALTGLLTLTLNYPDLTGKGVDLEPNALAISPEGSQVVVSGRLGLVAFARHRSTGELLLAENQFVGNLPINEVTGDRALTFSPRGRHLYALSFDDHSLLTFETPILFYDGFESGSTSSWSTFAPGSR